MRVTLITTMLAALASLAVAAIIPASRVQAQECTGENCPPTEGQGGHDCESSKEPTIS